MTHLQTRAKETRHGKPKPSSALNIIFLLFGLAILAWSAYKPRDYFTWVLEIFPAVIGGGVLLATYRRFRLSGLLYGLICVHAVLLMVGAHYTYAEMPLFNWIRDAFHLSRNHYDRAGHFFQGFVPALIAREVLLRTSPLRRGKWLSVIVVALCMAMSVAYEFFEWAAALAVGQKADAFLATQGDIWDTQWDMFLCTIGAVTSLLTLRRAHYRSMATVGINL